MRLVHLILVCAAVALLGTAARADHTIEVSITVHNGGKVGAHVSRYDGPVKIDVDVKGVKIRVPTGKSQYTKLMNRDDDSNPNRVTASQPWVDQTTVPGRGTYILDLADWDDHPDVSVVLTIDGVVRFKGRGSASNFDGWKDKAYGPGARKTDNREVAVDVGD